MTIDGQRYGKYRLLSKLGEGGMAEVFKAKLEGIEGFEKTLAIKRIHSRYSGNSEFIEMLIKEAKINVRLSHANIVQVYELGKVEDSYYIAMEFVDGKDLRKLMVELKKQKRKLPDAMALYIAGEILKGLDYAHRREENGLPLNIVHRDVSPSNILISYEGEVKILDFGIARAAGIFEETRAGVLKGKVAYMSPEQRKGEKLDGRSDIFAVGLLLYELLNMRNLFHGMDEEEIWVAFNREGMESLLDLKGGEMAGKMDPIHKIIRKSLMIEKEKRFQTAADFYRAIAEVSMWEPEISLKLGDFVHELFKPSVEKREEVRDREPWIHDIETHVIVGKDAELDTLPDDGMDKEQKKTALSMKRVKEAHKKKWLSYPVFQIAFLVLIISISIVILTMKGKKREERGEVIDTPHVKVEEIKDELSKLSEKEGGYSLGDSDIGYVSADEEKEGEIKKESSPPPIITEDRPGGVVNRVEKEDKAERRRRRGKIKPPMMTTRLGKKPESKEPASALVENKGFVSINVQPWAYVTIEGTSIDARETPIIKEPLQSGSYRATLSNPSLTWKKVITIVVESGKDTRVIMSLDNPSTWAKEYRP